MSSTIDAATEERLVRLAMREAAKAARRGDPPFGAVLADDAGAPILRASNTQVSRRDPTAHAEINLVRLAARRLGLATLDDLRVATNAEPCSMCLSAMVKSRVAAVTYGAPHEPHVDPPIPAEEVATRSRHHVELSGGVLAAEMRRPDRRREGPGHGRRLDDRRRTRAWRGGALAILLIALAAVACSETPPPPVPVPPTEAARLPPPTPAPVPTPVGEPAPHWAIDLLGQLECDGVPAPVGHERGASRPVGHEGTASPHAWLNSIDEPDMPLDGYLIEPSTPWEDGVSHFTRHVYRSGGEVKAVVLMEGTSTQGGPGSWDVTAFRACPPSEFDPADGRTTDDAPWVDADGGETARVHTIAGPGHCGWQSTVWLRRGDALYLRDPDGVLADEAVRAYTEREALPEAAVDTGLHSIRWRLFRSPNRDVVWMMRPDGGVEAWPRAVDPMMGCA